MSIYNLEIHFGDSALIFACGCYLFWEADSTLFVVPLEISAKLFCIESDEIPKNEKSKTIELY